MAFFAPLIISIILLAAISSYTIRLNQNIKLAKQIGLPYIILPWHTDTVTWFILAPWTIPILNHCLPSFLTRKWLKFMDPFWTWHLRYSPFQERANYSFLSVSAWGLALNTCSPEIIAQFGYNRRDFSKPIEMYSIVETFGPNLISTDGPHWKHQRRIIQPSFNEANNILAWGETVFQTTALVKKWVREMDTLGKDEYLNFHDDLRQLALHVVARGTFGERIFWANDNLNAKHGNTENQSKHSMSLGQATLAIVSDLKWLFILPPWILKWAPSKHLNKIWMGYHEIDRHMQERIRNRQISRNEGKEERHGHDILGSLISTIQKSSSHNDLRLGLTHQEIVSNVFVSLMAGHETTGATLFYTLINLAMYPAWQVEVQRELDAIFGDSGTETWSHGEYMKKLQYSKIDATILETLRLFPPNGLIPKHSALDHPSILRYKEKDITIPPNTRLLVMIVSAHRNPHYWPPPNGSFAVDQEANRQDTNEYRPERWFVRKSIAEAYGGKIVDSDSVNSDGQHGFFVPCKGAFIPWSIGARQCIGRNFAHVELLVAIAIILREWSVELVLDQVDRCDEETGKGRWESARMRAEERLRDGMYNYITMQLGNGLIPLRLVKRGDEGVVV
ncbi:cytochrome P450 [Mollisia scopiformis]|uniref:Cytochrome P450 n=1 Tax=Mollisia scopiformis TaxID=149040 RepID=A0A194X2T9_MOLSC|nr:cytochrome P450 [Mollisia scopiformis]KUJ14500.1 cytochrome P450 [Mollisia scopiformis]